MKTEYMAIAVLTAGLAACGSNPPSSAQVNTCTVLTDTPAPTQAAIDAANCPNNTNTYLSAVFDGDNKPVGVGGGTDAGTGNKNDKKVNAGQNICWVAMTESGAASTVNFDVLFSPSQKPTANQPYESVEISPHAQSKIAYKYTIWTDSTDDCNFLDPRFFVN